ncbi:hypothetical protein, partial [Hymenobacter coccineus]|uniref:hypothetical protein n=1 Tax=Hymenobacter coccineus TaxID=1908235 RepID=UPI001300E846
VFSAYRHAHPSTPATSWVRDGQIVVAPALLPATSSCHFDLTEVFSAYRHAHPSTPATSWVRDGQIVVAPALLPAT